MRRWKFRLQAKTPFYIGGHKIVSNHYETMDYIPATVLQAAFSRAILESHRIYDVRNPDHTNGRKYFINFESSSPIQADDCLPVWVPWFKHFNEIYFTDGTPMGAEKYAPATFACKNFGLKHPLVDTLPDRFVNRERVGAGLSNFQCSECGGRIERKDGWKSKYSIIKRNVTRIEMDYKLKVSKDERLFSLSIGEPFVLNHDNNETIPLYFEGYIYGPENIDLSIQESEKITLHVGGYITTGLGKMELIVQPDEIETEPQFNLYWENALKKLNYDKYNKSFAIKLNSDCLITANIPEGKFLTNEELLEHYTNWLREKAGLPEDSTVSFTYLQTFAKRGFEIGTNQLRAAKDSVYMQNGSVIIFESSGDGNELEKWIKNILQEGLFIQDFTENKFYRVPVTIFKGLEE